MLLGDIENANKIEKDILPILAKNTKVESDSVVKGVLEKCDINKNWIKQIGDTSSRFND